jgi:mono/diheme cytochrome c family protein
LALSIAVLGGCSATPLGATDAGIAAAREKMPAGADVYQRECASCHGRRGEGLSAAPNIMGAGALPVYARDPSTLGATGSAASQEQDRMRPPGEQSRVPFRTAQDLYDFVSKWMPLPQARVGTLEPAEYWAVVNFILVAHGVAVPAGGVTPENAKSIQLSQ